VLNQAETFTAIVLTGARPSTVFSLVGGRRILTFQKQLNTFARKRHHIPHLEGQGLRGQEVWVGAATDTEGWGLTAGKAALVPHGEHTCRRRA